MDLTRDVTLELMKNMDDETLLKFCRSNRKNSEICRNETFWRKRTLEKYENWSKFKSLNRTWKNYYITLIHYLNIEYEPKPDPVLGAFVLSVENPLKFQNKYDVILEKAVANGDIDIVNLMISLGANKKLGIKTAIQKRNMELLKTLMHDEKISDILMDNFIAAAIISKNQEIIDFIVKESIKRYGEHWTMTIKRRWESLYPSRSEGKK